MPLYTRTFEGYHSQITESVIKRGNVGFHAKTAFPETNGREGDGRSLPHQHYSRQAGRGSVTAETIPKGQQGTLGLKTWLDLRKTNPW